MQGSWVQAIAWKPVAWSTPNIHKEVWCLFVTMRQPGLPKTLTISFSPACGSVPASPLVGLHLLVGLSMSLFYMQCPSLLLHCFCGRRGFLEGTCTQMCTNRIKEHFWGQAVRGKKCHFLSSISTVLHSQGARAPPHATGFHRISFLEDQRQILPLPAQVTGTNCSLPLSLKAVPDT